MYTLPDLTTILLTVSILSLHDETAPEAIPKPNIDPTLVPLPSSELSGTSLGDSVCSMSPSFKSQSSSGEEDECESDYISGDDLIEDQNEATDGNIFEIETDDNVSNDIASDVCNG